MRPKETIVEQQTDLVELVREWASKEPARKAQSAVARPCAVSQFSGWLTVIPPAGSPQQPEAGSSQLEWGADGHPGDVGP